MTMFHDVIVNVNVSATVSVEFLANFGNR